MSEETREIQELEKVTKKEIIASLEEINGKRFLDSDGNPIEISEKEMKTSKKLDLAKMFYDAICNIASVRVNGSIRNVDDDDLRGADVEGKERVESAQLSFDTIRRFTIFDGKPDPLQPEEIPSPSPTKKERKKKEEKPKEPSINRSQAVVYAMLELGAFSSPEDLGPVVQRVYNKVNKRQTGSLKEAIAQAKKGIFYLEMTGWLKKEGEQYVVVDSDNYIDVAGINK